MALKEVYRCLEKLFALLVSGCSKSEEAEATKQVEETAEPGLFALDYTLDYETSIWPQDARELSADEKKELESVITAAGDTDIMFQALCYYFGSKVG